MIIVTPPERIGFSHDRIVWTFQDDGAGTTAPGVAASVMKVTGPVAAGAQLVIRWGSGGDLRLRASANPNTTGGEFPSGDGSLSYVQALAVWFEKNYYISKDFTITQASYEGVPSIFFYARRGGTDYAMAPTTFSGGIIVSYATGSDGTRTVNSSVFVEVRVRADNTFDYVTAYEASLPLNEARSASIDVGEILHPFLYQELPSYGLPEARRCIYSCRDYYIRYAHAGGEPFSVGQVETSEKYHVLRGGHSKRGNETRSVISSIRGATPAADKFLTIQERTRYVRVDEPLYLSWVNLRAAQTQISGRASITYEDGTSTTTNTNVLANVQPYEKVRFAFGFAQLNLIALPKRVKEYSVYLANLAGEPISETIRCIVDYSHREYIRYLSHFNSQGGVEMLKTFGKASTEFRVSKETAEKVLPDPYLARDAQYVSWGAQLEEIVEVATGHMPHRHLGHFLDFFLSDQKYRVFQNTGYPIDVNTDEVRKGVDGENFAALVFQFRYARVTDSLGIADLDKMADAIGIVPPGVQVAGEVIIQPPGSGEWSGTIDPFPISGSDNPAASGGVWSMLQLYQPLIVQGDITQYFRGDFSLGSLSVDVPTHEQDPTVPDFSKTLTSVSYLFSLIKTVDGLASGLDADLWRGLTPAETTVGEALKWAEDITISLTGAVTGSVDVDGSGNVSMLTTVNHTHSFNDLDDLPTTGGGFGLTDVIFQGGNSFGQNIRIGANDAYNIEFMLSGQTSARIGNAGNNYLEIVGPTPEKTRIYDYGIQFFVEGSGSGWGSLYGTQFFGVYQLLIQSSHRLFLEAGTAMYFEIGGSTFIELNTSGPVIFSRPIRIDYTGEAPLIVNSSYLVTNLNADLLDGQHGAYYLARANHTGSQLASTISDFSNAVLAVVLSGYTVGGNVAITSGDTFLQAMAKLQGQINSRAVVSSGTANRVVKFGVGSTIGNSQLFDDGTNIGLGTTSPLSKLHINGSLRITNGTIRIEGFSYPAIVLESNLGIKSFQLFSDAGSIGLRNNTDGTNVVVFNMSAPNGSIILRPSGNLGLGVSDALEKLHVSGSIRYSGRLISTIAIGTAPFQITSTTLNTNLNADLLDGYHASDFPRKNEVAVITAPWTFPGFLLVHNSVIGSVNSASTINIGTDANTDVVNIGRAAGTVNIYGSVNAENSTNLEVTNKTILLNDGGGASSGFDAGILIEEGGNITASLLTNAGRNGWELKAPGVIYKANIIFSTLTANRSYTLPDASGTIALQGWVANELLGYALSAHPHISADISDWSVAFSAGLVAATTTGLPEGSNLYFTNARVLSATLDSFGVGSNVAIEATDTVLQAFAKLQAQVSSKAPFSSGTAMRVAKFGVGGSTIVDSLIYDDGTNVGVGIVSPLAKLHIGGSLRITNGTIRIEGYPYPAIVLESNLGTKSFQLFSDTGSLGFRNNTDGTNVVVFNMSAPNGSIVLNSAGNLGLGLSDALERLHVSGSIRYSGRLISIIAPGTAPFQITSTTLNENLNADLWHGMRPGDAVVYKASAWETARTLTIGGAVSGSVVFDGSDNISLTVTSNIVYQNEVITLSGDATGSGRTAINVSLINRVTAGTYQKVTVNAKGLVIAGASLGASDIPQLTTSKITGFVAAVRDTQLTGLSVPGSPTVIGASHTVLQALGALQSQMNAFTSGTANYLPVADANGLFVDSIIRNSGNRVYIGSGTESGQWMLYVEGNIITKGMLVSTAPDGEEPMAIVSTTMVNNLNAHMLGGYQAQHFLNASSLLWGVLDPSLMAATGVSPGRYNAVTVDVKGRVMAGENLSFADILPVLPDFIQHDSRHPRFHRFSRIYIDQGVNISPPLVFNLGSIIASHHAPSSLTVKFIAKNVKSQGIEVGSSGLLITLSGVPEFTFDSDEIAVVVEDTEGNQTIVPIDLSVISSGSGVPTCPLGLPSIVNIVEATTTGIRPQINYGSIETLIWRVKNGASAVVASGSIVTSAIPSPVNQPWLQYPSPLPAGAYIFEVEGQSCLSSVASMAFNIVVSGAEHTITYKYYDVTTGSPVYVADITPGVTLPWFAKYNIRAEVTGLHNQIALHLTAQGATLFGWGPENIAAGGASVNTSSPWLFGPSGDSDGRGAGQATIRGRVWLQGGQPVVDTSVSFSLQEETSPGTTDFYYGRIVDSGGTISLADGVQVATNTSMPLPVAPNRWGLSLFQDYGHVLNGYYVYLSVLANGQWQSLRIASAPSHHPYIMAGSLPEPTNVDLVIDPAGSPLINVATGLTHSVLQPGTYQITVAAYYEEGNIIGTSEIVLTLYSNQTPTGLLPNPGIESATVAGRFYEWMGDGDADFEILPDGKVKINAPTTRLSFNGASTCNRFLHGGNDSEGLSSSDVSALFGDGLMLPTGLHSFTIHYYAATTMQEVYDNPWEYAIEDNPVSAGKCAGIYTIDILVHPS